MADAGETQINLESEDGSYWIWTAQLAKHRLIKTLGLKLFDITVKSGIREFSPTWDMLRAYKEGRMTERDYEREYIRKIERTFTENPEIWEMFLKEKNIVLSCYCTPGVFCHRLLFKDILTKYLCSKGKEVISRGELISGDQIGPAEANSIEEVDRISNIPH